MLRNSILIFAEPFLASKVRNQHITDDWLICDVPVSPHARQWQQVNNDGILQISRPSVYPGLAAAPDDTNMYSHPVGRHVTNGSPLDGRRPRCRTVSPNAAGENRPGECRRLSSVSRFPSAAIQIFDWWALTSRSVVPVQRRTDRGFEVLETHRRLQFVDHHSIGTNQRPERSRPVGRGTGDGISDVLRVGRHAIAAHT